MPARRCQRRVSGPDWSLTIGSALLPLLLGIGLGDLLIAAAAWSVRDGHPDWGFAATTAAIGATLASFWVSLYPNVMVSSTNKDYNLTVASTANRHYALTVMTVVAVVFTPLVLAYQGWSYYVFRARIKGPAVKTASGPAAGDPAPSLESAPPGDGATP